MKKIQGITVLRGIAILYLVLFHTGIIFDYKLFARGATTLSLFFMISGFVMSLVHKNDKGIADAALFVKKRITKIYLPFYIPFFVCLVLFVFSGKGSYFHRDIVNIVQNLFLIQVPYNSIHPYSWYLVFQIYYYASFCLFTIVFRVNVIIYALMIVLPYLTNTYILGVEISPKNIIFSFFCLDFSIGLIIGYYFDKLKLNFGYIVVVVSLLFFMSTPFLKFPFASLLTCAVLVLVFSKSEISINFFNQIGEASYSIFLVHAITLMVLKTVIDSRNFMIFVLFFTSSILCGFLYHHHVEKPLIRISRKFVCL